MVGPASSSVSATLYLASKGVYWARYHMIGVSGWAVSTGEAAAGNVATTKASVCDTTVTEGHTSYTMDDETVVVVSLESTPTNGVYKHSANARNRASVILKKDPHT